MAVVWSAATSQWGMAASSVWRGWLMMNIVFVPSSCSLPSSIIFFISSCYNKMADFFFFFFFIFSSSSLTLPRFSRCSRRKIQDEEFYPVWRKRKGTYILDYQLSWFPSKWIEKEKLPFVLVFLFPFSPVLHFFVCFSSGTPFLSPGFAHTTTSC